MEYTITLAKTEDLPDIVGNRLPDQQRRFGFTTAPWPRANPPPIYRPSASKPASLGLKHIPANAHFMS